MAVKAKAKAKTKSKKVIEELESNLERTTADAGDDSEDDAVDADAPTPQKRGRALVVVESPAKAKTIKKYLGAGFTVKASVGHVIDLPKSKINVDVEKGFAPEYVVIRGKGKIISDIKKSTKESDIVYLAPDPDREGEAIAWHLAQEIRPSNGNIKRILFNEITKRGITEALKHPSELNSNKFE